MGFHDYRLVVSASGFLIDAFQVCAIQLMTSCDELALYEDQIVLPHQPRAREGFPWGSCMESDPIYLGNVQSLYKRWRARDELSTSWSSNGWTLENVLRSIQDCCIWCSVINGQDWTDWIVKPKCLGFRLPTYLFPIRSMMFFILKLLANGMCVSQWPILDSCQTGEVCWYLQSVIAEEKELKWIYLGNEWCY